MYDTKQNPIFPTTKSRGGGILDLLFRDLFQKYFYFVFAGLGLLFLVACNPPESSKTPNQNPGGPGKNPDILSFSSPTDTDKSVVGMREFLLTARVAASALSEKKEIAFIVGESAEAPAWNTVENNPAILRRAFTADENERQIYFSATERLPENTITQATDGNPIIRGAEVDLSLANGKANELRYTREHAPGIMVPGQTYYVHAYSEGKLLKTQAVATKDYPAGSTGLEDQLGGSGTRTSGANVYEFLWGMDDWKTGSGHNFSKLNVEGRKGEIYFLPVRYHSAIDWDLSGTTNTYCTAQVGRNFQFNGKALSRSDFGIQKLNFLSTKGTPDTVSLTTRDFVADTDYPEITDVFTFYKSAYLFPTVFDNSEYDEVFDFVVLMRVGSYTYKIDQQGCLKAPPLQPALSNSGVAFQLTPITE